MAEKTFNKSEAIARRIIQELRSHPKKSIKDIAAEINVPSRTAYQSMDKYRRKLVAGVWSDEGEVWDERLSLIYRQKVKSREQKLSELCKKVLEFKNENKKATREQIALALDVPASRVVYALRVINRLGRERLPKRAVAVDVLRAFVQERPDAAMLTIDQIAEEAGLCVSSTARALRKLAESGEFKRDEHAIRSAGQLRVRGENVDDYNKFIDGILAYYRRRPGETQKVAEQAFGVSESYLQKKIHDLRSRGIVILTSSSLTDAELKARYKNELFAAMKEMNKSVMTVKEICAALGVGSGFAARLQRLLQIKPEEDYNEYEIAAAFFDVEMESRICVRPEEYVEEVMSRGYGGVCLPEENFRIYRKFYEKKRRAAARMECYDEEIRD